MKRLALAALLLSSLLALVACNGAAVLNTITPSSGFERERSVSYGPLERQSLDVYRAANPRPDAPVIVFVHGGGWEDGSKEMYKFVADGFTMKGFDVVVPDYRLHPEASYDTLMEDMGAAVAWTGERFAGRPLVLMGHSAGGYNVLQSVFAPNVLGSDACIAGVVALAAPTGAYELKEEPYISVFPERFRGMDAPLQIAKAGPVDVPPIMLVNGLDDTTVGPRNAQELADAVGTQPRLYEGMGHIDVVKVLSRHFDGSSALKGDIVAFVDGLPDPDCD